MAAAVSHMPDTEQSSDKRQVNIRIDRDLHLAVRLYALKHGLTFQELCEEGLRLVSEQRGISLPHTVSRGESGAESDVQADATTRGVAGRTRRAWKPGRDTSRTPSHSA